MVSGHSLEGREDNYAEPISNKGTMFSFFKSYYVDGPSFFSAAEK
jgi:hypothetical protein